LIYDCVKNNEITIYNNGSALRDIIPLKILCHYLYKLSILEIYSKTINIASGNSTSFMDITNILKTKNKKLKINNVTTSNIVKVLSSFPKNNLDFLGVIDFDLKNEILTIYDKLSEDINL
jgi:dTDP-D-glucose 4,6-dehydratase